MSSSTDRRGRRTSVLRDAATTPMPELLDLDSLSGAARRAVDPVAVAEAQNEGYHDGHAAGYRDGYDAGRREALDAAARADAARAEAVDSAVAALGAAAAELTARRRSDLAEHEDALVAGALELATAILDRELEVAESPGRDALARALRLADGAEPALARLHPEDLATLGDHADLAPGRDVTVVADPGVGRGGCVLEVGDGRVDARIDAALDRVRKVLSP